MAIQFPLNPVDGDEFNAVGRRFRYTSPPGVWESIGSQDAESDPIFSASPAAGITSTEITSWNEAYSWGDHGVVGYELASNKGIPNGYASLDANGKVLTTQVPPLAITEVFVVADEAARLALTAQEGDVAIQTDTSTTYIKNSGTSGTNADWNVIEAPVTEVDPVFSASPAAGISSGQISNWDFTAGTVTTGAANWDTAYSWGDHATAGYLTSYTEADTLDSVTGRGNITTNAIQTGNITAQNGTISAFDATGSITLEAASFTVPETTVGLIGTNPTIKMTPDIGQDAVIQNRRGGSDLLLKTSVTNNSPQTRMTVASGGNVGIGTDAANPRGRLEVKGDSATSNLGATINVIDSASMGADIGGSIGFGGTDGTTDRTLGLIRAGKSTSNSGEFAGYLAFHARYSGTANAPEYMRIEGDTGNVGIGDTPSYRLDVLSSSGDVARIRSANSRADLWLQASGTSAGFVRLRASANDLQFIAGNSVGMTLASNGNVGIGTSSPSARSASYKAFEVSNTGTANAGGSLRLSNSTNYSDIVNYQDDMYFHNDGEFIFMDHASNESMRITSAGNVGIGGNPSSNSGYTTLTLNSATNGGVLEFERAGVRDGLLYQESGGGNLIVQAESTKGLKFNTSGSNTRMTIASNGNVGIGTTPDTDVKLTVADSGTAFMRLRSTDASGDAIFQLGNATDTNQARVVFLGADESLNFYTSDAKRVTVSSSGNVGIGTDAPNEKLSLWGSGSATSLYVYDGGGSTAGRFTASGDIIDISARGSVNSKLTVTTGAGAGSTAMTIDSNGNVGIGETNPTLGKLCVNGTINIGTASQSYNAGSLGYTDTNWGFLHRPPQAGAIAAHAFANYGGTTLMKLTEAGYLETAATSGSAYLTGTSAGTDHAGILAGTVSGGIVVSNGNNIGFWHQPYADRGTDNNVTERMRIDSSGNLLIGKQAASAITVGPQLLPTGVFNSGIAASTNSTITNTIYSTTAAATRFYVGMGGTIFATSTSITAISDASLKENVRDLDKGLESIKALKPRRYDWKNGDGTDVMGFIAQEVEEVMPELVYDYQYTAEETKKGLKMGDMLPSMVKAIQELAQQVEDLQAELAALKSTGEA